MTEFLGVAKDFENRIWKQYGVKLNWTMNAEWIRFRGNIEGKSFTRNRQHLADPGNMDMIFRDIEDSIKELRGKEAG